jgi:hypothetical protein
MVMNLPTLSQKLAHPLSVKFGYPIARWCVFLFFCFCESTSPTPFSFASVAWVAVFFCPSPSYVCRLSETYLQVHQERAEL